jgi:hypothetical protein
MMNLVNNTAVDWMRVKLNLTRSEASADYYDPDAGIDPEVRDWAASLSLFPFAHARISPERFTRDGEYQDGFMFGQAGKTSHLVFVRVTVGEEQAEGAGPMPGILIDWAREIKAEPHAVRVHLRPQGEGTAVEHFGHEELERELKAGDHWRRALIGRRTARDYLRLVGGRLSKLEVKVRHSPPGAWPRQESSDTSPDEGLLKKIFGESDNEETRPFPGSVSLGVCVDTLPPEMDGWWISMGRLARSARESDEHYIFTCSCGAPGCAGLTRGVETVHEDGLVVWRIRGIRPRRVVVFDREQYRQEILSKVREALAVHKEMGPEAYLGASDRRECVEAMVYYAEEKRVTP